MDEAFSFVAIGAWRSIAVRSFPSRWLKFASLILPLAVCMALAGCGETAPPPSKGPTAEDDALRQQMLDYDKANNLSKQANKRR